MMTAKMWRQLRMIWFLAAVATAAWILSGCERNAPTKTAAQSEGTPLPTPQTVYMTEAAIGAIVKKAREEFAEEWKKQHPEPSPRAQPAYTPDQSILANVSEEARLREGFVLQDQDGKKFMRIYRKDGKPITEGLTSDTIAIETWKQPIYTNMGDGTWDVVFKERETPTSTPSLTPAPAVFPSATPNITDKP